jgi:hypothetical protein
MMHDEEGEDHDASGGLQHKESSGQIDSDAFTTVTNKKKSTQVTPAATTIRQSFHEKLTHPLNL